MAEKYRVWISWYPSEEDKAECFCSFLERKGFQAHKVSRAANQVYIYVSSPEEAIDFLKEYYEPFIDENVESGSIEENPCAYGLEEWDEDEQDWFEWYNEEGLSLEEIYEDYD